MSRKITGENSTLVNSEREFERRFHAWTRMQEKFNSLILWKSWLWHFTWVTSYSSLLLLLTKEAGIVALRTSARDSYLFWFFSWNGCVRLFVSAPIWRKNFKMSTYGGRKTPSLMGSRQSVYSHSSSAVRTTRTGSLQGALVGPIAIHSYNS